MRISELDVSPVLDVARRSKPTDLYAGSTDEARAPHRDLLDADAMLGPAIGGYLVREYGERAILADAGPGGHPAAGPFEMYPLQRSLLATLSVQGVGPDDVTDMYGLLSLARRSHRLGDEGREIVFRSATYWCHASDRPTSIGPDRGLPGS